MSSVLMDETWSDECRCTSSECRGVSMGAVSALSASGGCGRVYRGAAGCSEVSVGAAVSAGCIIAGWRRRRVSLVAL